MVQSSRPPRVKIDAVYQWNTQKTKLAQVDLTATFLKPEKANTAIYTITTPGS